MNEKQRIVEDIKIPVEESSGNEDHYQGFNDNISVFSFDTSEGSPYSKRYPTGEKRFKNNEFGFKENLQNTNYSPSISEGDFDMNKVQDLVLPIEMRRYQSMQSLRSRRDPVYQGNRSRKSKRVIYKSGERNVENLNVPQRSWMLLKDSFATLIDERWRYVITVFALIYVLCCIIFSALWYLVAHTHGDLDPINNDEDLIEQPSHRCVEDAKSFAGFLLFSIGTQVSIGYGLHFPNETCPAGIILIIIQLLVGIAIEGAMVGIVYAKMIRPPKYAYELKFSKKAVICQRNSKLCLVFRVCDSTQSHTVESTIRAYWFQERSSVEGENLKHFQNPLKLDNEHVFLIHPQTVCHTIDHTSPLYDISAKDLLHRRFEIILTLTGSSTTTGQTRQSRTSFLSKEILWGYRFVNILEFSQTKGTYIADYSKFDDVEQIDAPLCSARRLDEVLFEMKQMFDNDVPPEYANQPLNLQQQDADLFSSDIPIGDVIIEPIPKNTINLNRTKSISQENVENVINETSEMECEFKMKKMVNNLNIVDSLSSKQNNINKLMQQ